MRTRRLASARVVLFGVLMCFCLSEGRLTSKRVDRRRSLRDVFRRKEASRIGSFLLSSPKTGGVSSDSIGKAALRGRKFIQGVLMHSVVPIVRACRPWSLTPTISTMAFSTAVAHQEEGPVSLETFALTLGIGCGLQTVANVINSIVDLHKGVDTWNSAADRSLVEKHLTVKQSAYLASVSMSLVLVQAAALARRCNVCFPRDDFTKVIIAGTVMALTYSLPPGLKYMALGEVTVAIAWATEAALVYFVQSGEFSIVPVTRALPLIMQTVAILLANNIRDMDHDKKAGVKSLSGYLGCEKSFWLYSFLLSFPYVLSLKDAIFRNAAYSLPLLTLPALRELLIEFRRGDIRHKDEQTAKLQFTFGILATTAELIGCRSLLSLLDNSLFYFY